MTWNNWGSRWQYEKMCTIIAYSSYPTTSDHTFKIGLVISCYQRNKGHWWHQPQNVEFLWTAKSHGDVPGQVIEFRRKINMQTLFGLCSTAGRITVTVDGNEPNADLNWCEWFLRLSKKHRRSFCKANVNVISENMCLRSVYVLNALWQFTRNPLIFFIGHDIALFHLSNIIIMALYSSLPYTS